LAIAVEFDEALVDAGEAVNILVTLLDLLQDPVYQTDFVVRFTTPR
jgi:hypothetical protein